MVVVCKYYQQGNCRYGQYCQYKHINTFGTNNKAEPYNEDVYAASVAVAKEVLIAERGGQWLLSCFGPFKDRPSIPGMEDLSPEEVRWEMYQAQKNGMVEQAKVHFRQLCQDMKAKRDALKNPTHETVTMLKKLVGTNQKGQLNADTNTTSKSSNFAFPNRQLPLPNNTSASNVFGNKTFGTQSNPFSGGFASASNNPIFGNATSTSNPIFGGNATFGNNLGGFGNTTNTNSVFGGSTNTSTFNAGQNTQAFGSVTPQNNSIFGGASAKPVFGQPSVFGSNTQVNNVFARPQTTQSATSIFNSGSTSTPSLFSNAMTSQANPAIFGGSKPTITNPFSGSSTLQTTNPVFVVRLGNNNTTPSGNFTSGTFFQPKTMNPYDGAPIFGGGASFAGNTAPIFGEQATFGATTRSNNIFGGSNTTAPVFSSAGQTTSTFGSTVPAPNLFGNAQNNAPVMSAANTTPFGTTTPTTSGSFVSTTSQFDATSTTAAPFSRPTFGLSTGNTGETFGTTVTSAAPFGTPTTASTFGTPNTTAMPFTTSNFGDLKNSPFASTNTTVTTTTSNPFAPRTQQTSSPFGNVQNQTGNNTVTVSASVGPFGKSPFGSTVMSTIIDDTVYTVEGQLTDDEKSMYLAEKFIFGKIPLKAPTKDIR